MRNYLLTLSLLLSLKSLTFGTDYYLRPAGNDAHAGTSAETAWKTLAKLNGTTLLAGDRVFFEGGSRFAGTILVAATERGTSANPIVFKSFGTSPATISSGDGAGLVARNTAGIKIENLKFEGAGRETNQSSGIVFSIDADNSLLDYLLLDNVEVSGYREFGILISSERGSSGFQHVTITNSSLHDNGDAGLKVAAAAPLSHKNWHIAFTKAYNNSGRTEVRDRPTGGGLLLGGLDGATVEHCEAYNNGWLNNYEAAGPTGIMAFWSNNVVIQKSESHHNKQGGGFDLDLGSTNCVMQYNYSHDNEGPGFAVNQSPDAPAMSNITVRYNISQNDARKGGHGAISLWSGGGSSGMQRVYFYNNTVFITPPAEGSRPHAISVWSGGMRDVHFWNNIFQTEGGLRLITADDRAGLSFKGNAYWSSEGAFKINWGSTVYSSFNTWRTSTNQESLDNAVAGLNVDPELEAPGRGGTLGNTNLLTSFTAYQLKASSPLNGAGLDLAARFGVNVGTRDFFDNQIPNGRGFNIGSFGVDLVVLSSDKGLGRLNETALKLFPVPAVRDLHLTLPQPVSRAQVTVLDGLGRVVIQKEMNGQELGLDVTGLSQGIYLLQLETGKKVISRKVVLGPQ